MSHFYCFCGHLFRRQNWHSLIDVGGIATKVKSPSNLERSALKDEILTSQTDIEIIARSTSALKLGEHLGFWKLQVAEKYPNLRR